MRNLLLLALPALLFACSSDPEKDLVQPRSISVSSNATYDSVAYVNHGTGITLDYSRISDTTFTDPVTKEVVPGVSYKVLVYDSVAIKAPWEGKIKIVSFRRPSTKPALNLSSKNAPDNVYFVRKEAVNNGIYSHFFYYNRIPSGTLQPMVCRFVVGKYAADTDKRYLNIPNWDRTTVIVSLTNGGELKFFIENPYAGK